MILKIPWEELNVISRLFLEWHGRYIRETGTKIETVAKLRLSLYEELMKRVGGWQMWLDGDRRFDRDWYYMDNTTRWRLSLLGDVKQLLFVPHCCLRSDLVDENFVEGLTLQVCIQYNVYIYQFVTSPKYFNRDICGRRYVPIILNLTPAHYRPYIY